MSGTVHAIRRNRIQADLLGGPGSVHRGMDFSKYGWVVHLDCVIVRTADRYGDRLVRFSTEKTHRHPAEQLDGDANGCPWPSDIRPVEPAGGSGRPRPA